MEAAYACPADVAKRAPDRKRREAVALDAQRSVEVHRRRTLARNRSVSVNGLETCLQFEEIRSPRRNVDYCPGKPLPMSCVVILEIGSGAGTSEEPSRLPVVRSVPW